MRSVEKCVLFLLTAVFSLAVHAEPDAAAILKNSDQARGGGFSGLVWKIYIQNSGSSASEQQDQRLLVKATDRSSVAEVLEPANSKGSKMLQVDRNMWISKPGLKKPVAISPRQRLTGQAAVGDIAATNYAYDYEAKFLRNETIENEDCYVLELSSVNRQSTYDRITYWVSTRLGTAVQADFLSLSGKKIKSARFEYGNNIRIDGKKIPFVSKMIISDALTDAISTLEYTDISAQRIPKAEFDVGNL